MANMLGWVLDLGEGEGEGERREGEGEGEGGVIEKPGIKLNLKEQLVICIYRVTKIHSQYCITNKSPTASNHHYIITICMLTAN